MILSIAWKNVWRSKLRSMVVIVAVTLGLMVGVFSSGFMNGMMENRIRDVVYKELSHIQIHNPSYLDNSEIKLTIQDADKLISELESLPEVKSVSKRLRFETMINTARKNAGVVVYGVVPEKEKQVSSIYQNISDSSGSYFDGTSKYKKLLISTKLAKKLGIQLKSKPILSYQTIDGTPSGAPFKVTGLYKTKNSAFDEMNVFVEYGDLIELMGFEPGSAHEINILLNEGVNEDEVAARLAQKYPELEVLTWKVIAPEVGMIADFLNIYLYVFVVIILLALGFGIINTMLMVVLERVKELGMLMAIGMNKARVFKMIMLECTFLSLTGGVLGMLGGALLIYITGRTGLDLSMYAEGMEQLGYDTLIYPRIGFDYYIVVTLLVTFTGIISSIYPARKALKLNPADAIRTEL